MKEWKRKIASDQSALGSCSKENRKREKVPSWKKSRKSLEDYPLTVAVKSTTSTTHKCMMNEGMEEKEI
jgi:hypothetical protein